jgi:hypothetical protein
MSDEWVYEDWSLLTTDYSLLTTISNSLLAINTNIRALKNMDFEEYMILINSRDVLDYTTLNVTLFEVSARKKEDLAKEIQRILKNNKIEKPILASNPEELITDYYKVDLTSEYVKKIIHVFRGLETSYLGASGETTPTAALYASFVDKWNKLK